MAVNSTTESIKRYINQTIETANIASTIEMSLIPAIIPVDSAQFETANVTQRYFFHSKREYNNSSTEPTLTGSSPVDAKSIIVRKVFPGNYVQWYDYDLDLYTYDKVGAHTQQMIRDGALAAGYYLRTQIAPPNTDTSRIFFTTGSGTGGIQNIARNRLYRHATSTTTDKCKRITEDDIRRVRNQIWEDFGERERLPITFICPPEMYDDLIAIYKNNTFVNVNQSLLTSGVLPLMDGVIAYRSKNVCIYQANSLNDATSTTARKDLHALRDPVSANRTAIVNANNTIGGLFIVSGQGALARSQLHSGFYMTDGAEANDQKLKFSLAPQIAAGKTRTTGEGTYALLYSTTA